MSSARSRDRKRIRRLSFAVILSALLGTGGNCPRTPEDKEAEPTLEEYFVNVKPNRVAVDLGDTVEAQVSVATEKGEGDPTQYLPLKVVGVASRFIAEARVTPGNSLSPTLIVKIVDELDEDLLRSIRNSFGTHPGGQVLVGFSNTPKTVSALSGSLVVFGFSNFDPFDPARDRPPPVGRIGAPPIVNFGTAPPNTFRPKSFLVRNNGLGKLTVTAVTVTGDDFRLGTVALPLTVSAQSVKPIELIWDAGAVTGRDDEGTALISSNDPRPGKAAVAVALRGRVVEEE